MKDGFKEGSVLDGRFEAISPLNHGSFGMVFLAKDITNGEFVAIKCLTKQSSNECSVNATSDNDHLLELACHSRLDHHPNVVNLLHAFETDAHMYLVLEYCSMGDLYEAIRLGRGPLKTEHVRDFMLQLVGSIEHMHSKGLYHRDIKPENIFLTQDGSMKLGDFGLATTELWSHESSVGSDRYMAPEQYEPGEVGYSPAQADTWAIGICLLNILFSRNPFVTPTESDVLFADYVRDRQSLFDVFPNMSQDTYEVLIHAMAIDPSKRSLLALREALKRVISFTTDDEALDEFCTDEREVVPASANRQPLRTPSIQSPAIGSGGAFPWAKALHLSPPQTARQLSTIKDTESYSEDLFPASEKDTSSSWYSVHAQTPSLASVLDSALGASIKSMTLRQPQPRNAKKNLTPLSESLPTTAPKAVPAMSMVFAKKENVASKSWSDLWDEDEEADNLSLESSPESIDRSWSRGDKHDDPTVRISGFNEVKNESTVNAKTTIPTQAHGDGINENDGFFFQDIPEPRQSPTYSPPSKRQPILDRWAALGNRRRAVDQEAKGKVEGRKRASTTSWRRGFGLGASFMSSGATMGNGVGIDMGAGAWEDRKGGNKDKGSSPLGRRVWDWRRDHHRYQQHHLNDSWFSAKGQSGSDEEKHTDRDSADIEWVGGWKDLHL